MLCWALNKYFISQKCSGKRWGRFFNAQKVGPYPQIAGTAQFQLELISLTLKHILTIGKYEARIRTQRVWSTDFFVINWLSTLSPHQVLGREGGNLIQFRKINLFCEDFLNSIPSSIKWKYFSGISDVIELRRAARWDWGARLPSNVRARSDGGSPNYTWIPCWRLVPSVIKNTTWWHQWYGRRKPCQTSEEARMGSRIFCLDELGGSSYRNGHRCLAASVGGGWAIFDRPPSNPTHALSAPMN